MYYSLIMCICVNVFIKSSLLWNWIFSWICEKSWCNRSRVRIALRCMNKPSINITALDNYFYIQVRLQYDYGIEKFALTAEAENWSSGWLIYSRFFIFHWHQGQTMNKKNKTPTHQQDTFRLNNRPSTINHSWRQCFFKLLTSIWRMDLKSSALVLLLTASTWKFERSNSGLKNRGTWSGWVMLNCWCLRAETWGIKIINLRQRIFREITFYNHFYVWKRNIVCTDIRIV